MSRGILRTTHSRVRHRNTAPPPIGHGPTVPLVRPHSPPDLPSPTSSSAHSSPILNRRTLTATCHHSPPELLVPASFIVRTSPAGEDHPPSAGKMVVWSTPALSATVADASDAAPCRLKSEGVEIDRRRSHPSFVSSQSQRRDFPGRKRKIAMPQPKIEPCRSVHLCGDCHYEGFTKLDKI